MRDLSMSENLIKLFVFAHIFSGVYLVISGILIYMGYEDSEVFVVPAKNTWMLSFFYKNRNVFFVHLGTMIAGMVAVGALT